MEEKKEYDFKKVLLTVLVGVFAVVLIAGVALAVGMAARTEGASRGGLADGNSGCKVQGGGSCNRQGSGNCSGQGSQFCRGGSGKACGAYCDEIRAEAARALGISPAELGSELAAGKSLGAQAAAKGISGQQMTDILVKRANELVDAEVASGKLAAGEGETVKASTKAMIENCVKNGCSSCTGGDSGGCSGGGCTGSGSGQPQESGCCK